MNRFQLWVKYGYRGWVMEGFFLTRQDAGERLDEIRIYVGNLGTDEVVDTQVVLVTTPLK